MIAAFDHIAHEYDKAFSWSPIGMLQRQIIWGYLEETLKMDISSAILELNCGTGEDAIWFANHNQQVLATDISPEMIRVAQNKARTNRSGENICFEVMDLLNTSEQVKGKKFDLVFSNFGGFNCLDEPQLEAWLNGQLPALLKPGGRFVAVLMSKFCAWESLYFLFKFQFANAFRRLAQGPVEGKLNHASSVPTWYFSPIWIKRHLPKTLIVRDVKPVGVFIPPSYLNHFFFLAQEGFIYPAKIRTEYPEYEHRCFFQ